MAMRGWVLGTDAVVFDSLLPMQFWAALSVGKCHDYVDKSAFKSSRECHACSSG